LPVLKVLGWDDGDTVLHLADAHHTLVEKLRWPDDPADTKSWRERWAAAFTLGHREVITTTQELVEELARLAVAIRKRANTILARESQRGPMQRLYAAFRTALIHDLTEDDFADVIAQTISYGLLAARFSHPGGISVQHLVDMIPATNPFLRELLEMFLNVAGRKEAFDFDELGIQDVVELLNHANAEAVKADFGNRTKNEDPIVHFYEHFLKAYDAKKKVQRGVFYTPQPVVSYIVRSVHELLQTEFGIEDGLASTVTWGEMMAAHPEIKLPKTRVHREGKAESEEVEISPDEFFVQVLDPATGTATFLVEVIEAIFSHLINKWNKDGPSTMPVIPNQQSANENKLFKDYWNAYVPHALLPRLYGYEIMMAPYTIAHMKLGLKLVEINTRLGQPDYEMKFEGRAHIYLTNSLEPPSDMGRQEIAGLFPALAHEARAVNEVKRRKRFTVVIGNPPYSLWSQNLTQSMRTIVDPYRSVAGEPIKERGALQFEKILQDDYVKFFRFSQVQLDEASCGILGLITNHAFLDNPTLRGMRFSLLSSFHRTFCINLHGSSSKKERCQDGSADENVFDIKQGVAIFHGLRLPRTKPQSLGADLWGTRSTKYTTLQRFSVYTLGYRPISPGPPLYLLKTYQGSFAEEYEHGWKLTDVFGQGSMGVVTARDHVSISFDDAPLLKAAREFRDSPLTDEAVCRKLEIPLKKGWDAARARMLIRQEINLKAFVKEIDYRPFDCRKVFYHKSLVWGMSWPTMRHILDHQNIGFSTTRTIEAGTFQHVFCSKRIIGHHFVSLKEVNHFFPLWLYDEENSLAIRESREPNLKEGFLRSIAICLGAPQTGTYKLPEHVTPENIFHYTYAVFHSPTYRTRYAEFLKMDFPRLPLPSNLELFRSLAKLGGELVALHIMESSKLENHITKWLGTTPSSEVDKVTYGGGTVWIDKTKSEGFRGVLDDVWNFHIGGYQVCEKWLKDRKGRRLSAEDIQHYQRIVVALNETIRLMGEIDQVIEEHGGWPGAFS
jgi:predicted helicase